MKQCTLCGRLGSRFFTPIGGGRYICTFTRACGVRRRRLLR